MTRIEVAKSSGFCSGVRKAIDISLNLLDGKKEVYILGDIVHNTFVVKGLEQRGIQKIKRLRPRKGATLLIRAHGAPRSLFLRARKMGYKIADATCPKVKEIYHIARKLEKNNKIIIIGDKDHDEVKGIAGQLSKKPVIIESVKDIDPSRLSRIKKAAVVTQSTQSSGNIMAVMDGLSSLIPGIKLYDTTCRITRVKQAEIKSLAGSSGWMFVVGSRTSANTRRLYEISRAINKNTFLIESARDVKLPGGRVPGKIGIMAGASTPDEITMEILARIKNLIPRRRVK